MSQHTICLTVDTDPDGLSGKKTNRAAMTWQGLERASDLSDDLAAHESALGGPVPLTWFVRVDGHMRTQFGSATHLLEQYADVWERERAVGNELAWHPHLYIQDSAEAGVRLIDDCIEACDELSEIRDEFDCVSFAPTGFRNGEAWHQTETMNLIEEMGFLYDSSAVPGRCGPAGHPMDWRAAPNEPFYPSPTDVTCAGPQRSLIEVPMNTWYVKAPWDSGPTLRYMNPAIHKTLFAESVGMWLDAMDADRRPGHLWVLVMHPNEIMEQDPTDGLIAHDRRALFANLEYMLSRLAQRGDGCEFVTMNEAVRRWRESEMFAK